MGGGDARRRVAARQTDARELLCGELVSSELVRRTLTGRDLVLDPLAVGDADDAKERRLGDVTRSVLLRIEFCRCERRRASTLAPDQVSSTGRQQKLAAQGARTGTMATHTTG